MVTGESSKLNPWRALSHMGVACLALFGGGIAAATRFAGTPAYHLRADQLTRGITHDALVYPPPRPAVPAPDMPRYLHRRHRQPPHLAPGNATLEHIQGRATTFLPGWPSAATAGGRRLGQENTGGVISSALSGCPMSGFAAPALVGGQRFMSIADTGSANFVVASQTCDGCGNGGVGYVLSDTGYVLSETVGGPARSLELFFGDSASSSNMSTIEVCDAVSFANGPSVPVVFANVEHSYGFFQPVACNPGTVGTAALSNQALMGLGGSGELYQDCTSYILEAVSSLAHQAFSLGLCTTDGMIYLGGYLSNSVLQAPFYTPIPAGQVGYSVAMTQLIVGNTTLPFGLTDFGYALVDSGMYAIVLPQPIFNAITAAIATASQGVFSQEFFTKGECIQFSAAATVAEANALSPSLTFGFANPNSEQPATITESASSSYLYLTHNEQGDLQACPLLASSGTQPATILGSAMMRELIVIFDIAHQQIGFAPSQGVC